MTWLIRVLHTVSLLKIDGEHCIGDEDASSPNTGMAVAVAYCDDDRYGSSEESELPFMDVIWPGTCLLGLSTVMVYPSAPKNWLSAVRRDSGITLATGWGPLLPFSPKDAELL